MSRLSNIKTIKVGFLKSWNSVWFDDAYYSNLLFQDLKIKDYLTGLFYKLRTVTDYYYVYSLPESDLMLIKTNLILLSGFRYKSYKLKVYNTVKSGASLLLNRRNLNKFSYYNSLFKSFVGTSPIKLNIRIDFKEFIKYNYIINFIMLNYNMRLYIPNVIMDRYYFSSANNINSNLYEKLACSKLFYFVTSYSKFNSVGTRSNDYIGGLQSRYKWYVSLWFHNSVNLTLLNNYYILTKYYLIFNLLYNEIPVRILSYIPLESNTQLSIMRNKNIVELHNFRFAYLNKVAIVKSLFNNLRNNIEKTISLFTNKSIYFSFSIFMNRVPYLVSSKMIVETLVFLFRGGNKIAACFFFINNWHTKLYHSRRMMEHLYFSNRHNFDYKNPLHYLYHFSMKRSPIIGIRIECSGSLKKGMMAKVYHYNNWIKDTLLTGRLPHNTLIADIDYYQSYVSLKSSSIGIKVWLFLETHLYNVHNQYVTVIY